MKEKTKRIVRRGIAALAWVETRLGEVERDLGSSPDLLRLKVDCSSLVGRLAWGLEDAEDTSAGASSVDWEGTWPIRLSGQDLVFLQSLREYLVRDSKGGGGHLRALMELERFISKVEWV
jgi:hypothetical protein